MNDVRVDDLHHHFCKVPPPGVCGVINVKDPFAEFCAYRKIPCQRLCRGEKFKELFFRYCASKSTIKKSFIFVWLLNVYMLKTNVCVNKLISHTVVF